MRSISLSIVLMETIMIDQRENRRRLKRDRAEDRRSVAEIEIVPASRVRRKT